MMNFIQLEGGAIVRTEAVSMIRLFRLDGLELMLNADMIKDIRAGHPTVLTLVNGETIEVKNTLTDVLTKIRAHRMGIEDENREFDANRNARNGEGKPPAS
jgi:uncharacterized protein YlzI (FlbEa/FlbD family)